MKTKMIIAALMLISINLFAQSNDSLIYRPVQFTYIYPLGSNGINSLKYTSNFSFNILFGLNGGLKGVEIGSIFNYNKKNVTGVQIAGVANINSGTSQGVLISGVTNVCRDSTEGVLISGVLNNSKGKSKGVQVSTVNVSENDFTGVQVGVVNTTKKLKGLQVGLINYVEEDNGALPIGLISIVKNGHYEFELATSEVLFTSLNFKIGVEKFYTIFKAGFSTFEGQPLYGSGFGFGTIFSIDEKQKICLDLTLSNLLYKDNWKNQNSLNENTLTYKYKINKHFGIFGGPSFKVYKTELKIEDEFGSLKVPYSIYSSENSNRKSMLWIGFNAGISVNL